MGICRIFVSFWIGFSVVVLSAATLSASQETSLEESIANLRNSDAEWRRENSAYREQRLSKSISSIEAEEYAEFVAGLHRQKLEDCETVRIIGGDQALKGFDCIKLEKESKYSVIVPPPKANNIKTESEKIDALEAKLKRLEAELDEELLRKQQIFRQNAPSQSANNNYNPGSVAGASGGRGTGAAKGGPSDPSTTHSQGAAEATESGNQGNGVRGLKRRNYDPGAGPGIEKKNPSPPPSGGPSENGSDDDVVMRQIRDAAERETDPVLKKKLWEEYRKLKTAKNQ